MTVSCLHWSKRARLLSLYKVFGGQGGVALFRHVQSEVNVYREFRFDISDHGGAKRLREDLILVVKWRDEVIASTRLRMKGEVIVLSDIYMSERGTVFDHDLKFELLFASAVRKGLCSMWCTDVIVQKRRTPLQQRLLKYLNR